MPPAKSMIPSRACPRPAQPSPAMKSPRPSGPRQAIRAVAALSLSAAIGVLERTATSPHILTFPREMRYAGVAANTSESKEWRDRYVLRIEPVRVDFPNLDADHDFALRVAATTVASGETLCQAVPESFPALRWNLHPDKAVKITVQQNIAS